MMKVKVPKSSDAVCVLFDVYHSQGRHNQSVSSEVDYAEINLPDGAEIKAICCQFIKQGNQVDLETRLMYDIENGGWAAYDENAIKSLDNSPEGGDPESPELKVESKYDEEVENEYLDHEELEEDLVQEDLELDGEASVEVDA